MPIETPRGSGLLNIATDPTAAPKLDIENLENPQASAQAGRVLGWMREAIQEGSKINRNDPSYDQIEAIMTYISGQQRRDPNKSPLYLPNVQINQARKAAITHVSALTDVRPTYAYDTKNDAFKPHAQLLNSLVMAWWLQQSVDLELGVAIIYAWAAGNGDVEVLFDPDLPGGGDLVFHARDPRDTLPIRPSPGSRSVQDWEGLILQDAFSPNVLRAMYPQSAHLLIPKSDGVLSKVVGRFRTALARLVSPAADTLSGLSTVQQNQPGLPTLDLYRAFLKDASINTSDRSILMGKPGANWSYTVAPNEPLYPRGRLIVSTEGVLLYDGPNPYWHGQFPLARLKFFSLPWQFLGMPVYSDVIPLQDAINDTVNDILMTLKQWTHRGSVYDRNAVPRNFMKRFDPRKPNWKTEVNAVAGEGFKLVDGPDLPSWTMNFLELLFQKHDEMTGSPNLSILMQLGQMPGADTIETYHKAMTPELKHEARQIEAFLRQIADMQKCNLFQFYTPEKRKMLLGDQGVTLADLDLDPGNLIPAMAQGDKGYVPQLDASQPLEARAQFFMRLFTFYVRPNTLLGMFTDAEKLKNFQLARMGYLDFWTFMEMMEVANVGTPPPTPLPPLEPPDQETSMTLILNAAQGNLAPMNGYLVVPESLMMGQPQFLQLRVPSTITERLQAQQLLGIGMTENPAGRKASAQAPQQLESKDGGTRSTVSESRK